MRRTGIFLLGLWLAAPLAAACDMPVHEYALENWQPDDYILFYFHDGAAKQSPPIHAIIQTMLKEEKGKLNLAFQKVDVSNIQHQHQREIYKRCARTLSLPFYAMTRPNGMDVFSTTQLTQADLEALVRSPMRRKLAELLCERKKGVLLFLAGSKKGPNERAAGEIRTAIEKTGTGAGSLRVERSDPREVCLVRQLCGLTSDLLTSDAPMVFPIIGRGFVLNPLVGSEIASEEVEFLIAFMNGPCTCDIKAMNEGGDLLVNWDWDEYVSDSVGLVVVDLDSSVLAASAGEAAPTRRRSRVPAGLMEESSGLGTRLAVILGATFAIVLALAVAAGMLVRKKNS